MSLTVKAFLAKDGQWDAEIRRFQVPAEVSSSFENLSKKLIEVFSSLRQGNFSSYWKDSEGDVVAFSTDEELKEALAAVNDGILNVYITIKSDDDTGNQSKESGTVHPGINCNGCEGSICGPRYKCLVCPDYDLCKECHVREKHMQHDMMKIVTPDGMSGRPLYGRGKVVGQGFARGPQKNFLPPPHFRRWMQKFMKRWHKYNSSGKDTDNETGNERERSGESTDHEDPGTSSGEEHIQTDEDNAVDMMHLCSLADDDGDNCPETAKLIKVTESEKCGRKFHGHRGRGGHLGRGGWRGGRGGLGRVGCQEGRDRLVGFGFRGGRGRLGRVGCRGGRGGLDRPSGFGCRGGRGRLANLGCSVSRGGLGGVGRVDWRGRHGGFGCRGGRGGWRGFGHFDGMKHSHPKHGHHHFIPYEMQMMLDDAHDSEYHHAYWPAWMKMKKGEKKWAKKCEKRKHREEKENMKCFKRANRRNVIAKEAVVIYID